MIQKEFVDRHIKKANGAKFFGVPIENLSHDELVACAVCGWEMEKSQVEESKRQRRFLLSLMKSKN
jgi:hypothetical protein